MNKNNNNNYCVGGFNTVISLGSRTAASRPRDRRRFETTDLLFIIISQRSVEGVVRLRTRHRRRRIRIIGTIYNNGTTGDTRAYWANGALVSRAVTERISWTQNPGFLVEPFGQNDIFAPSAHRDGRNGAV